MSHDRNDLAHHTSKASSSPMPEEGCAVFRYDSEAQRIEATILQADTPIIVCKGEPLGSNTPESANVYAGWTQESAPVFICGSYSWAGRELDYETSFQYNRVRGRPDPTQGRFIEEQD
jgi:hypothetical protein